MLGGGEQPFEDCRWISAEMDHGRTNQWVCFRKEFDCTGKEKEAIIHIAVDSKYWLWVNGRLAVFEGGLKRGPNPQDTYYDSVEIGPYLSKGKNTIAVLVWYWGRDGFCHKNSGRCGLIADIRGRKMRVVSDSTWKAALHPSFGDTGDPKPNFRLPESNVRFDARMEPQGWMRPEFDDSAWKPSLEMGLYPCEPWNALYPRPIPNWKDSGVKAYEAVEQEEQGDSLLYVTGRLPRNISVTPWIKVRAQAGRMIDLRSDNYCIGGEYCVRGEYITREGTQEFELPCYLNGHAVIYSCPKDVEVLEVGYRETAYDTRHLGRFQCSDDFYDRLWQKSLCTMNLNMRDCIQDPDRERSQWWGDAAIVLGEILYSCDQKGASLIKKAIDNLVDWQKPDGTLYSPVPAGSWDAELPLQMLASIGKYGFWTYYYYTGDRATLEHAYPAVKKYLALWQLDEKGLVVHRAGGWDWPDWGEHVDVGLLDNVWFCLALEAAAQMALTVGDEPYAQHCDSLLQGIRTSARQHLWAGHTLRSPNYEGPADDRGNGLSILAGIPSPQQTEQIANYMREPHYASPYMEKYVLESFFVRNDIEGGLTRMKQRYAEMVDAQTTTLWEHWTTNGGSINHGWSGGPLTLLSQYVAGISPAGVGWKKILIHPQLGHLEWVECDVPVCNGTVGMKARRNGDTMRIEVRNSTGRPCLVAVPPTESGLRLNGKAFPANSLKTVEGALNSMNDGLPAIESPARKIVVEYKIQNK